MTPYLSRLRPADRGPRLRPRPRSTFEPAPLLPIDGPPISQPEAGVPASWATAGAEIELDHETPYPHPASPAVAATSPGDQAPRPLPTAVAQPAGRDADRPAKPAATSADAPINTSRPASSSHQTERHSDADDSPWLPGKVGRAQAPWSITRHPSPPADEPRLPSDRSTLHVEPAPPASMPLKLPSATPQQAPPPVPPPGPAVGPPAPHRKSDKPVQRAEVPASPPEEVGPAAASPLTGAAAPRVPAMAQQFREADTGVIRDHGTTKPPNNTRPAAAPSVRVSSQPAASTELTVTIGRIEVKATAPDPTPPRAPSSGPRRRPPSLDDYLAARARARGGAV